MKLRLRSATAAIAVMLMRVPSNRNLLIAAAVAAWSVSPGPCLQTMGVSQRSRSFFDGEGQLPAGDAGGT